jgi:membrane associated rhomboid family serine protease
VEETPHCYRHPSRETMVSCSECGRPICEDCMNFAPVGIRCPDHANIGAAKGQAKRTARRVQHSATRSAAPATIALIAINVVFYLITVAQGGGINSPGGSLFGDMWLSGIQVWDGDWYRLATVMFLHGSMIHLLFNMLALYWLGTAVEQTLGTARFVLLYAASGLAGSAGALLLTEPYRPTVGASGAIFGIMGALLILEYRATGSLAGQAATMIVINLALTFAISGVSIGGHIGGLIGGIAATWGLTYARRYRSKAIGPALVVAVGVLAVVIAVARVKSYSDADLAGLALSLLS